MQTILEIDSDLIRISAEKGFLAIERGAVKTTVPLHEIESLVINSRGAVITNHAIMRLGEYNIPIIHCGANNLPIALTLACANNVYRKERISLQLAASAPFTKNLWKHVVTAKITNQARVLELLNKPFKDLDLLAAKVLSGDTDNKEATAARFYWQRLMGTEFRRDTSRPGANACLNYGYAILRASFCRAITASGFLPEIGIHHNNMMDPYCLADDLMEPLRPFIDIVVSQMDASIEDAPDHHHKKALAAALDIPVTHGGASSHLRQCAHAVTDIFIRSLKQKKVLLQYPVVDSRALSHASGTSANF